MHRFSNFYVCVNVAPHPYFDASVTKVTYQIVVCSGGYHDLPSAVAGGACQKNLSSFKLLFDNFTRVLCAQPSAEFKSAYNVTRWNLPRGSALHVDCR